MTIVSDRGYTCGFVPHEIVQVPVRQYGALCCAGQSRKSCEDLPEISVLFSHYQLFNLIFSE